MITVKAGSASRKEYYGIFKSLRAVCGYNSDRIALRGRFSFVKIALPAGELVNIADKVIESLERACLVLSRVLVKKHKIILALLLVRGKCEKSGLVIELHQELVRGHTLGKKSVISELFKEFLNTLPILALFCASLERVVEGICLIKLSHHGNLTELEAVYRRTHKTCKIHVLVRIVNRVQEAEHEQHVGVDEEALVLRECRRNTELGKLACILFTLVLDVTHNDGYMSRLYLFTVIERTRVE